MWKSNNRQNRSESSSSIDIIIIIVVAVVVTYSSFLFFSFAFIYLMMMNKSKTTVIISFIVFIAIATLGIILIIGNSYKTEGNNENKDSKSITQIESFFTIYIDGKKFHFNRFYQHNNEFMYLHDDKLIRNRDLNMQFFINTLPIIISDKCITLKIHKYDIITEADDDFIYVPPPVPPSPPPIKYERYCGEIIYIINEQQVSKEEFLKYIPMQGDVLEIHVITKSITNQSSVE